MDHSFWCEKAKMSRVYTTLLFHYSTKSLKLDKTRDPLRTEHFMKEKQSWGKLSFKN